MALKSGHTYSYYVDHTHIKCFE